MEKWEKLCRDNFTVGREIGQKVCYGHQSRVIVDQKQMPAVKEERERKEMSRSAGRGQQRRWEQQEEVGGASAGPSLSTPAPSHKFTINSFPRGALSECPPYRSLEELSWKRAVKLDGTD